MNAPRQEAGGRRRRNTYSGRPAAAAAATSSSLSSPSTLVLPPQVKRTMTTASERINAKTPPLLIYVPGNEENSNPKKRSSPSLSDGPSPASKKTKSPSLAGHSLASPLMSEKENNNRKTVMKDSQPVAIEANVPHQNDEEETKTQERKNERVPTAAPLFGPTLGNKDDDDDLSETDRFLLDVQQILAQASPTQDQADKSRDAVVETSHVQANKELKAPTATDMEVSMQEILALESTENASKVPKQHLAEDGKQDEPPLGESLPPPTTPYSILKIQDLLATDPLSSHRSSRRRKSRVSWPPPKSRPQKRIRRLSDVVFPLPIKYQLAAQNATTFERVDHDAAKTSDSKKEEMQTSQAAPLDGDESLGEEGVRRMDDSSESSHSESSHDDDDSSQEYQSEDEDEITGHEEKSLVLSDIDDSEYIPAQESESENVYVPTSTGYNEPILQDDAVVQPPHQRHTNAPPRRRPRPQLNHSGWIVAWIGYLLWTWQLPQSLHQLIDQWQSGNSHSLHAPACPSHGQRGRGRGCGRGGPPLAPPPLVVSRNATQVYNWLDWTPLEEAQQQRKWSSIE